MDNVSRYNKNNQINTIIMSKNNQVKDKEITMSFKNYKLLEDLEIELHGSYLYFIKAKNDTGKTSIMEGIMALMQAKNLTPEAITTGKDEAIVRGSLPGPNGMYTVEMKVTKKGTSFTMITPDDIKVKTATQIREVFEYNTLSVEDFIRKSSTPDGRREQIKVILQLLKPIEREEYTKNLSKLDSKKGSAWLDRSTAKSDFVTKQSIFEQLEKPKNLSLVHLELDIKNHNEAHDIISKSFLNLPEYTLEQINKKVKEINDQYDQDNVDYDNDKQRNLNLIKSLEEQIKRLKGSNIKIDEDKITLSTNYDNDLLRYDEAKKLIDPKTVEQVTKDYNESESKKIKLNSDKTALENYNQVKLNLDKSTTKVENAEKAIQIIRNDNSKILSNSDLSSLNISIKDDTLYIGDFVFNEHQIADSKLILTAANILAKTLHKSQILCVGKLAELDKESRLKLYQIGQENNIAIIGDDVDDEFNEIYIKGHENSTPEIDLEESIIVNEVIENIQENELSSESIEEIEEPHIEEQVNKSSDELDNINKPFII